MYVCVYGSEFVHVFILIALPIKGVSNEGVASQRGANIIISVMYNNTTFTLFLLTVHSGWSGHVFRIRHCYIYFFSSL